MSNPNLVSGSLTINQLFSIDSECLRRGPNPDLHADVLVHTSNATGCKSSLVVEPDRVIARFMLGASS